MSLIILDYVPGTVTIDNYTYKSRLMLLTLLRLTIFYIKLNFLVNSSEGRI